jgi:hypothetical protein
MQENRVKAFSDWELQPSFPDTNRCKILVVRSAVFPRTRFWEELEMSVGFKLVKYAGITALCLGTLLSAYADSTHTQKKTKKQELPPLPSGPTGQKLQPLPLDSLSPVLPQVSYENGLLTINATNSTLGDILRAVHKQTGAEIEIPVGTDRVVTHLGPGPARDVMAELLNGSRFNYVLLASPEDPSALTRVVLVAKSDAGNGQVTQGAQPVQRPPQPNMAPPPQDMADSNDADQPEENADENNADQPQPEPEQPAGQQGDQSVKTPQQMLQEMQQQQLQQQQQGQPGQPGQPFPGRPPLQQPPQPQQQ